MIPWLEVTTPMSREEIQNYMDGEGKISFGIHVPLTKLVDLNDGLAQIINSLLFDENTSAVLSDLEYQVGEKNDWDNNTFKIIVHAKIQF